LQTRGQTSFGNKGWARSQTKWVDDHIFFRIPRAHISTYNAQRAEWCQEKRTHGGRRKEGSRIWYGAKNLPNGTTEEFDEDFSARLIGQAAGSTIPRSEADRDFAYADADIDELSAHLSIKWESSKSVPFGEEVPYLGFQWNLRSRVVYLPDEKKTRYLAVIAEWREKRAHNLLEMQRLYGKLLHTMLVVPARRAHLTSLEAMLASFNNNPFRPHTPPRSTLDDLVWWQRRLSRTVVSIPIPRLRALAGYTDASSAFGVLSRLAPDGARGGWSPGGSPKEDITNGRKRSASSYLPSAYALFQARGSTSCSMAITEESSKDGGRGAA
jgi:hypothetical protein